MSLLLKKDDSHGAKADLSTFLNKKESYWDRDSPRRMEILIKRLDNASNAGIKTMDETETGNQEDVGDGQPMDVTTQSEEVVVPKESTSCEHDLYVFRMNCVCTECLKYRETLIQLVLEDREFNTLWDRLKTLIREFYDIVPLDPDNSMNKKYEEALIEGAAHWLGDGIMGDPENILPLNYSDVSTEMTFILVFSMLHLRDPHQLFELICIQLRCIAIAYSEGLKEFYKPSGENEAPTFDPIQLMSFVLDGYDKFCETAKKLSTLLFELQRDTLQNFSLTWMLLNKRMYQRWVYLDVQEIIPDCILQLKEILNTEDFNKIAHRLIEFDDDMTSIAQTWIDVWSLLQDYHTKDEDIERRHRIFSLHTLLMDIKECSGHLVTSEDPAKPAPDFTALEDRDVAWALALKFVHMMHDVRHNERLTATVQNSQCSKCHSALASHYVNCDCRTCLMAGGPCANRPQENTDQLCCSKCSFYKKLDRNYLDKIKKEINGRSDATAAGAAAATSSKEKQQVILGASAIVSCTDDGSEDDWVQNHSYHLAWALFKHLPGRKPYKVSSQKVILPNIKSFCTWQDTPCTRNECRVATHILAGLYPFNFAKFLVKAYQPLQKEERNELMNIQKLYFTYLMQKLCDDKPKLDDPKQPIDLMWNIDDADYSLFCDIGSAFAEYYLADIAIPIHELLESCFLIENGDIELNMYWLECSIYLFKESENWPCKNLENDPKVLELQLRMQMDQLNLSKAKLRAQEQLLEVGSQKAKSSVALGADFWSGEIDSLFDIPKYSKTNSYDISSYPLAQETRLNVDLFLDDIRSALKKKKEAKLDELIKTIGPKKIEEAAAKTLPTSPKKETKKPNEEEKTIDIPAKNDGAGASGGGGGGGKLADDVKIAVKQKLNQKLEAELKSLKKEHSALKDMVRDLEQIKENEENQVITKKEKGHHCCSEHSEMMENYPKICHRGDGLCTCYYCTIFGHSECNHGRSNETRDRLRKRLHQIHSKNSTKTQHTKNIKNQPGVLKRMLAAKVPSGQTPATSTSIADGCATKTNIEQKENTANESIAKKTMDPFEIDVASDDSQIVDGKTVRKSTATLTVTTTTTIKSGTTTSTATLTQTNNANSSTVSKKKLNDAIAKHIKECSHEKCKECNETPNNKIPASTKAATTAASTAGAAKNQQLPTFPLTASVRHASFCPTSPSEMASLDDILQFIEGNATTANKKDIQKKAAKKAKQKQKKEDEKKIEKLVQLREEFHDWYFREFEAKNELKNLKGAKKRDKKKVSDIENNLKKYGKIKSTLESSILELIFSLKSNNAEFKFAYLPTKEQQLQQPFQKQKLEAAPQSYISFIKAQRNGSVATPSVEPQQQQNMPLRNQAQAVIADIQQQQGADATDPSKRMVTIRRVNVPNAEPQVTITAKVEPPCNQMASIGFPPGKGKNSLNESSATKTTTTTVNQPLQATRIDHKKNKKELKQQTSVESVTSTSTTATINSNSNPKTVKKLSVIEPPALPSANATKKVTKDHAKINGKGSRKQSNEDLRSEGEKKKIALDNAKMTKAAIEASDQLKEQKKKGKRDLTVESTSSSPCTSKQEEGKVKKEKKKIKYEYADPNYKINKFDLLVDDDDDDDEYYLESSSEEEVVEPVPVVVKPVAPVKQEPVAPAVKSMTSKATKAAKESENKKATGAKTTAMKTEKSNSKEKTLQAPQKTAKVEPAPIPAAPVQPPTPELPILSKRQQKKLLQKQKQEARVAFESANADSAAKSLTDSMAKLHMNADTAMLYGRDNSSTSIQGGYNVSIMDQLNRGVNVERLTLPPGITLTRVDAATAEGLRAKKQTIDKLSHVAQVNPPQPPSEYQRPPNFYLNGPTMINPNQDPNGFIMVDPLHSTNQQQANPTSKKSKRNKKKKNKNAEAVTVETENNPKMVTLRNPLFQTGHNPMHPNTTQPQARNTIPYNMNPAASIIKNENGMYTIRNTALHQALSNGVGSNFRQYSSDMYSQMDQPTTAHLNAQPPQQHGPGSFSYFSDGMSGSGAQLTNDLPPPMAKHSQQTAIGSEIKNAQQMKSMPWNGAVISKPSPSSSSSGAVSANGDLFNKMSHLNPQQTRSYSPFDPMPSYGFNSDFIGSSPTPHSQPSTSGYYNSNGSGYTAAANYNHTDSNSLFCSSSSSMHRGSSHRCDDSPPIHDMNQYYNNGMSQSYFNKYDDIGNLQSGHRLNSEVTIHNVADANFHREQAQSLLTNGVEITRIAAPLKSSGDNAFGGADPNLAVGSHRQATKSHDMTGATTEYGDNIFAPNQAININELESEERDIESFKRFNYFFEPPKNKPKVNFNVKDIVVAKKHPSSDNSSPYFGDLASHSNTPSHSEDDLLYHEFHALNLSSSATHGPIPVRPQVATANRYDNFLHGIIGDELKTGPE